MDFTDQNLDQHIKKVEKAIPSIEAHCFYHYNDLNYPCYIDYISY